MKSLSLTKCVWISLFLPTLLNAALDYKNTPKLTVIFVIDQFAHHYLNSLAPYLQHGIKTLVDKGISYDNAYMPHGIPSTGPGHTSLNTGAYPKDHGIIGNKWSNVDGIKVACDDDLSGTARVISPDGFYENGKSPNNIMVNGISDYFAFTSRQLEPHHVYSISSKSRAAICTANKGGKAIWLDDKTGLFTSSEFYFPDGQLPEWLKRFNERSDIPHMKDYTWHMAYPWNKRAYNFPDVHTYLYSRPQHTFIGNTKIMDPQNKSAFYEYLEKTPGMASITFKVAKHCIHEHVSRDKKDKMVLWVCISNLDKIGHTFGCNSIEAIDTIYHLDKQIQEFMRFAQRKVGDKNVLFVLTADHGMAPTPEIAKNRGFIHAHRIGRSEAINELDSVLHKEFNVDKLISSINGPNVYLDDTQVDTLATENRSKVAESVKAFLLKKPYIKNAWTYTELNSANFCCNQQLECAFKNQLFPGRSGSVIFQVYPHNFVTTYPLGADHKTPYEFDTHIPLVIYQAGRFEEKMIVKKVYGQQLAGSLSTILRVPKPDVNPFEILPGLFCEACQD